MNQTSTQIRYLFTENDILEIVFQGDFLLYENRPAQDALQQQLQKTPLKKVVFKGKQIQNWDSSLLVILYDLIGKAKKRNIPTQTADLPKGVQNLLHLAFSVKHRPPEIKQNKESFLEKLGERTLNNFLSFKKGVVFTKDVLQSVGHFLTSSAVMRPVDFLFALQDCGYQALPIVAVISFMVGLIFGFVGSMQLKLFGAQIYVASLVAISMVRVMGAMMTGIIMAGRTGAAFAATIGTMQVNEETDALQTMGLPVTDFLLLPKILALMLTMPFLTVFSDLFGILGGSVVGIFLLDLSPIEYWNYSINALNLKNFFIGVLHGFVFGIVISLCGCYYGIYCGKDADGVGKATTNAVVASIVWIIICTAVITVFCEVLDV
jgi:phospholipid/cholesterol/gamma-HCH transport system permease protein